MLKNVPETMKKDSVGWVCGAEFDPPYRDSENFVARHLLSFDYDHITHGDLGAIREALGGYAYLSYSTFSHTEDHPRYRFWLPLSRGCGYDEFQAVSRAIGSKAGIERAARESHVPAQYMFKPAIKPFEAFDSEVHEGAWVDVDEVLGEYDDWTDRSSWPHRADGDGVHSEGTAVDPRTKPGIVGAFCRAFTITEAIDQFELPYAASSPGRYTYTQGSRPDGCIIYDEDTKLHSHHDTDPARGQSNAFDLVRLHRFGSLDKAVANDLPLAQRPSSKKMAAWAREQPAVALQHRESIEFDDLDAGDTSSWDDTVELSSTVGSGGSGSVGSALPERIRKASSKQTDQENARRIQRKFGHQIISIGKMFYYWTGTHWGEGEAEAFRCITALSQMCEAEADKYDATLAEDVKKRGTPPTMEEEAQSLRLHAWAKSCGDLKRISACEKILRTLLKFEAKELNKDEHLFSCANGTIDLRTGILKPHDPKDFITACSPIAYDPAADAPRFQRFLAEIYNDDAEVAAFAKRWFGYCITGATNEHKMVFHVGRGGNGKSTLMDALKRVLGEGYYSTAPQKILSLEESGATPDLAALLGKRMVTIAETDENLELREGLVKQITGGDSINARRLFKDPFEFTPTHKLQIFTNFTPAIKSQDFAMWRRILLLNYPVSYGDQVQIASGDATKLGDPHLDDALRAEAPGILAWLVAGAREWYEGRLKPPTAVLEATHKYREDQDIVGQFARERLERNPSAFVALNGVPESVFPAYRGWCASMNCRALGRARLVRELLRVMPGSLTAIEKGLQGFMGFKLTQEAFLD